jgi:D-alanine-D-alanine ligase
VYIEDLGRLIDFAFVVGHGKFMEDGRLQGILEILNIPYNGAGVLGSALAGNKLWSRKILEAEGIDVPRYMEVTRDDFVKNKQKCIEKITEKFSYPCIVKPSSEGCSTAIAKAKNKNQLIDGIRAAF